MPAFRGGGDVPRWHCLFLPGRPSVGGDGVLGGGGQPPVGRRVDAQDTPAEQVPQGGRRRHLATSGALEDLLRGRPGRGRRARGRRGGGAASASSRGRGGGSRRRRGTR